MVTFAPRSILCVHPNKELYGSDRTFLQAIRAFQTRWPNAAITALIPGYGLLTDELQRLGITVHFDDLFVLRRSRLAELPRRLLALPRRIAHARRVMHGHDLVYINTIVLLDFLLASRSRRGATLVHVHELPTGRAAIIFGALLAMSRGRVVFISKAVQRAFPNIGARGCVVWNGVAPVVADPSERTTDRPLRVLLIGRFNAWKGQGALIEALASMGSGRRAQFAVRMVGSVYEGQEHFARAIADGITANNLNNIVSVQPFTPMPEEHYRWADVVVVPSSKPEPFGLVAIEAMAAGLPVIASDHGGLSEIVVDGHTGWLVPSGDPGPLVAALNRYADNRALAAHHGAAGRQRFSANFDEVIHLTRLADIAAEALVQSA